VAPAAAVGVAQATHARMQVSGKGQAGDDLPQTMSFADVQALIESARITVAQNLVEVKPSCIPFAGDGLFAKNMTFDANSVITEYLGQFYSKERFEQKTASAERQGIVTSQSGFQFRSGPGRSREYVIDPDAWMYDREAKAWENQYVPAKYANDVYVHKDSAVPLFSLGIRIRPLWAAKQGVASPYVPRDNGGGCDQLKSCNDLQTNARFLVTQTQVGRKEFEYHVFLVATQKIEAGQEIFVKYGPEYWLHSKSQLVLARLIQVLDQVFHANSPAEAVTFNQLVDIMFPEFLQFWSFDNNAASPYDNWRRNILRWIKNRKSPPQFNGWQIKYTDVKQKEDNPALQANPNYVVDVMRPMVFLEHLVHTDDTFRRRMGAKQPSGKQVVRFYIEPVRGQRPAPWGAVVPLGPPRQPTAWPRASWQHVRTAYRAYHVEFSKKRGKRDAREARLHDKDDAFIVTCNNVDKARDLVAQAATRASAEANAILFAEQGRRRPAILPAASRMQPILDVDDDASEFDAKHREPRARSPTTTTVVPDRTLSRRLTNTLSNDYPHPARLPLPPVGWLRS